jgi:hypothetical protein
MNTKAQTENLMRELLSFAKKMLSEHGEFHPFAGYLKSPAIIVHVGVNPGEGGKTALQRVNLLISSLKKISDDAIAIGIVTDVRLPNENGSHGDAIRIFLEHKDGYCADVFFRYEVAVNKDINISLPIAQHGTPVFYK